jgi:DNA processing protein
MQVSKISSKHSAFPDILRELHKPVESLNVLGELPNDAKLVAIVGTRKCTPYGERVAYQLGSELAKAGVVVVSGLAYGIDSMAHKGAVEAGGRTIAVLAHSLDRIYPVAHRSLAMRILETGGALISEYDMGTPPFPGNFVERNRIIAAISHITVVVESPARSGANITARDALNIGRTVMAVPGNITSLTSAGPHNLIRKGAPIVRTANDIITELGFVAREAIPVPAASAEEAQILSLLGNGAGTTQELIERSGMSAAEFANIISLMEISGKVVNLGAGQWAQR